MKRIVFSLSILAALGACSRGGGSPGDTVKEFFHRGAIGECVGLRDLFATPERGAGEEEMGQPTLVTQIERVCTRGVEKLKTLTAEEREQALIKQANVLDTREEGDRAIVKMEVETKSGEKSPPQLVALRRQHGRWRIDLEATQMLGMVPPDPMPSPSQLDRPPMMPPPGFEPMPSEAPPATPPSQPTPAPRNQPGN